MKRLVLFMMAVMLLSITVNAQKKGGKTLVAYFSATGTTARAAKLVAEAVDGTLYEIQPAKKYTAADLDWHDKASRSSVEMSDSKSRPALYSKLGSLAEYDTIYIGFPIWWNLAPRIINTFIAVSYTHLRAPRRVVISYAAFCLQKNIQHQSLSLSHEARPRFLW